MQQQEEKKKELIKKIEKVKGQISRKKTELNSGG